MQLIETSNRFEIVDEDSDNGDTIAIINKTDDEARDAELRKLAQKMAKAEELYSALKVVDDAYRDYCDDETDKQTLVEFMDEADAFAIIRRALRLADNP